MPPKRMLTALKGQKRPRFVKISHFWGKNVLSHTFFSKWIDRFCCTVAHTIYRFIWKKWGYFLNLHNLHFSNLFWDLSNDLFVEISKPEGAVFHKDQEYTKKAIWEISAKYIDSFETADMLLLLLKTVIFSKNVPKEILKHCNIKGSRFATLCQQKLT